MKHKKEKESFKQLIELERKRPFPQFILIPWIEDLKKGSRACPCLNYFISTANKYAYCPSMAFTCSHCVRTKLWRNVVLSRKWNKYRKKLIKTLEKIVAERQKCRQKN